MPLTIFFFKKNTKFEWSKTTNEFFSKLESIFVTVFLSIQFDNTRETVLEINFSIWYIGGILFQYIDGIFRLCVYYFKKEFVGRMQLRNLRKKMLTITRCFENGTLNYGT